MVKIKHSLAIVDLDGTILYTLVDLKNSMNFTLKKFGFPERTLDEVRIFVGIGIRNLIIRAAPKGTDEKTIDEMFEVFNEHYAVHCNDNTKSYDGIDELLKKLKEQKVKTAVVSNKADYAVQTLVKKYFDGLFDYAVGEKQGVRKKPCPDSVNEVLRVLDTPKEAAVYIGDSEVDVATAKNAQMDCIAVDWGFRDREVLINSGATLIVSDAAALYNEI